MTADRQFSLTVFEDDLRAVHRHISDRREWSLGLLSGYCAVLSKKEITLDQPTDRVLCRNVSDVLDKILSGPAPRRKHGKAGYYRMDDITQIYTTVPSTVATILRDNPDKIDLSNTDALRRIATAMPKQDADREVLGAHGRIYTGGALAVPTKLDGTKYVPMAIKKPSGHMHYIFDLFTGEKGHILRSLERSKTLYHCTKGVFKDFADRAEAAIAAGPR